MIVEHFRRMDKGSYKFWMTMSELKALKLEPHGKAREPYINVMSNIQIGN